MSRVHSPQAAHTHRADGPAVLDLIERLEKADRGSPELSAHVIKAALAPAETWVEQSRFNGAWCIYERPEKPRIWEATGPLRGASVTESLDAALALAERVLPGWTWLTRGPDKDGRCPTLCFARLALPDFDCVTWEAGDQWTTDILAGRDATAHAATPALALCIAVLRATTPAEADAVGTEPKAECTQ